MKRQPKRYDYVFSAVKAVETDYAFRRTRFADGGIRKVLRRLVREAVRRAAACSSVNCPEHEQLAKQLATELIP